jgi:hypothetical protein
MDPEARTLLEQAWTAVGGGDSALARLSVTGSGGQLPTRLAVEETALACVGAALLAAAALAESRGGGAPEPGLDRARVAAAVRSEAHFCRGGRAAAAGFAPLSRFWPAADGWVRTHGNYAWHRAALLRALGARGEDEETVAAAIAALPAREVEERVLSHGGVAAAVRPLEQWRAHPQGRALSEEPLVGTLEIGEAAPRARRASALPADLAAAAALDGLRRQGAGGGTQLRRLSLARTAQWLTSGTIRPAPAPAAPDEAPPPLVELRAAGGPISAVAPPGELDGKPLRWPEPASSYGGDPAEWRR